jgi:hypothetical protein
VHRRQPFHPFDDFFATSSAGAGGGVSLAFGLRVYWSSRRFSRIALKLLSKLAANGAARSSREYFPSKRLARRHNGSYDPRELEAMYLEITKRIREALLNRI